MMRSWICTRRILVRRRAIPLALAEASFDANGKTLPDIQRAFELSYRARRTVFEDALLEARDVFAGVLAHVVAPDVALRRIPRSARRHAGGGRRASTGRATQRIFREAFAGRRIEPGTSP